MRAAVFLPALFALAVGCTSPEKRYEQASSDEVQGRWASAAEKYIDVLRRDREYPGAHRKATETGNRAVAGYVKVAGSLESAGRHERALDEYRRTDRLLESAAVVGVVLETPPDYARRRGESFHRAAEQALAGADGVAADGRWHDAADAYRAVEARYELSAAQRERAREGRYRELLAGARAQLKRGRYDSAHRLADEAMSVYGAHTPQAKEARGIQLRVRERRYRHGVRAARESADAGRYQEAYRRVERALAVFGPDAKASATARDLQARIVREGTVHVVFAPVWKGDRVVHQVPTELLGEINDVLESDYLGEPPMFVGIVEPLAVRRAIRQLEFDREVLSPHRARTLGQGLRARYVVVVFVAACDYDRQEQPAHHVVATRNGHRLEIKHYRKRSIAVRCEFRLVDAHDGNVVAEGRVAAVGERDHTHGVVYQGDADDLLLTREEHSWFDEHRLREVDREIEREIAQALARGVAEAVLNEVTQRLP